MAKLQIKKATKQQSKLRMALCGPSGSGKTYSALRFAFALGKRVLVIDTERGSASKYAGDAPDGISWDFDVIEPEAFAPDTYTAAINLAAREDYEVLIIDSLSHAWAGRGGALEIKDNIGGNSWSAWRKVTPLHDRMVDAILTAPFHVIVTMRSKMAHVQEQDEQGKTVIRKVGMEPVQRQGMEYEFDIVCDLDWAHIATVSKTRCSAMDAASAASPGPDFMAPVLEWLSDGVNVPAKRIQHEDILLDDAPEPEPEPEPEQNNNHWMAKEKARRRFWALTNELGLSCEQVHELFGVESMYEYPGTMVEARNILDNYTPPPSTLGIHFGNEWQPLLNAIDSDGLTEKIVGVCGVSPPELIAEMIKDANVDLTPDMSVKDQIEVVRQYLDMQ
jgi:hypothetical protein